MKDTHLLTIACSLALIAIIAVFIGYATDTLPQQKQRAIITESPSPDKPIDTSKSPIEKEGCHCCKDRMAALIKFLRDKHGLENGKTNTAD